MLLRGRYYNDPCFTDEKTEYFILLQKFTWPVSGPSLLSWAVWSDTVCLLELSEMLKGDLGAEFPRRHSGGEYMLI